jgi:hypothetical protein
LLFVCVVSLLFFSAFREREVAATKIFFLFSFVSSPFPFFQKISLQMLARSLLRFTAALSRSNSGLYGGGGMRSGAPRLVRFFAITTTSSPAKIKEFATIVKSLKTSEALEKVRSAIQQKNIEDVIALPKDETIIAAQRNAYLLWRNIVLYDKLFSLIFQFFVFSFFFVFFLLSSLLLFTAGLLSVKKKTTEVLFD